MVLMQISDPRANTKLARNAKPILTGAEAVAILLRGFDTVQDVTMGS